MTFFAIARAASAAALLGFAAAGAQDSADDIDFGDDASLWAEDGECDDPRFEGPGLSGAGGLDRDRGHDATDCRTAYEAGEIGLAGSGFAAAHAGPTETLATVDASAIDFGDDASIWSNDGECDDKRFSGPGMTSTDLLDSDVGHDATDCREAYEAGELTLAAAEFGASETISTVVDGIDFGDDESIWANDGECDDKRFSGPGMTSTDLLDEDVGHDATDCRTAYEAGELSFGESAEFGASETISTVVDGVDFGDDASTWANDGECDDKRFSGPGMTSTTLLDEDIGHDATDCRAAYQAGELTFAEAAEPAVDASGIDFGDDSGTWANDGECDDPRFEGPGMTSTTLLDEDIRHDATDCRTAWEAGELTLKAE